MSSEDLTQEGAVTQRFGIILSLFALVSGGAFGCSTQTWDVVVYGGTSAGVAAAVQARRMGKSVVLIEPSAHIGGLTTGGLGATDIGNKQAVGGIAREFYERIGRHYRDPAAWVQEAANSYESGRRSDRDAEAMWTFEPHVASDIYAGFLAEAGIEPLVGRPIDLDYGVFRRHGRIEAIRLEGGKWVRGAIFIDATYEGDLLALAGVSFHVGREANARYGETLNGVQTAQATKHQFQHDVDPFEVVGAPTSGLLPGIDPGPPLPDGSEDTRVQAYCFRMCLTDAPGNRLPIEKPADYDPRRYEILLRYFEAGFDSVPWNNIRMPNRKTDINNNHAFSTDHIGANYEYPNGDYATRKRIVEDHRSYQLGLLWCLANETRVPAKIREEVKKWGLPKDEFIAHGNWPPQLYIREARRMIGEYVMTQHDCQGRKTAPRPISLAAYTMDSHNVQRYVKNGAAINEGDVQVGGFPPYPIDYGAIVPKREECRNLLVPVCLSASHIAYGSIRMEPVFMVLGQSAATAAAIAIDNGQDVQDIDYAQLRERLLADGQTLVWAPEPEQVRGIDPAKLEGIIIDDRNAELDGTWIGSAAQFPFIGDGYVHDDGDKSRVLTARFEAALREPGRYEVAISYSPNPNRSPMVPVEIHSADGVAELSVDQRSGPTPSSPFIVLGFFRFETGKPSAVRISTERTAGHVIVDAVRFRRVP
jgi:hypothetical protein